MNPWQMAQQIRYLLQRVRWAGGSQELVFGDNGAFVYAGSMPAEDSLPPGFPFALVTIDTAETDADDIGLLTQRFSIVTAVEVAGDPLGEFAVIGSARADVGKSAGAGIAEVSERVRAALKDLSGIDGAQVVITGGGVASPGILGRGRHLAFDQFTVSVVCTSEPYYAPPQELTNNGRIFSWAGDHCEVRFDFLRYRLGYTASGTGAVDTPAALTSVVYTGTHRQTHAPTGDGTFVVFADYNARGGSTPEASSDGTAVGAFVDP